MLRISSDIDVDVVVVGSGVAGCAAALAARAAGLEAIVLEKAAKAGGGTSYSNGGIWIAENHFARERGISDSKTEGAQYLHFLGAGYEVDENLNAYIDNGPSVLQYFGDLGITFQLIPNLPDIYYDRAPGSKSEGRMIEVALFPATTLGDWRDRVETFPFTVARATFDEALKWGGRGSIRNWDQDLQRERKREDMRALGAGLIAAFVKQLLDREVPILLECPADHLIVDQGRVTGIVARSQGSYVTIRARKGVVLAAGGYEGNAKLTHDMGEPRDWRSFFPPTVDGDAFVMACEIGARVYYIGQNLSTFIGYAVPSANGGPELFRSAGTHEVPYPHSLVVNRAGARFGDETFFQDLLGRARYFDLWTHTYPNQPCFFVFDAQYAANYSFAGSSVGEVPSWVPQADTVEDLATKLGIDPEGLRTTVARYNSFAATGRDEDFGRGAAAWSQRYNSDSTSTGDNPSLGALDHAPYFGVKLQTSGHASAGLLTNACGQVIHQRERPIPGLYASGNCAAPLDFGAGYQAGLALGRGMIFSYLAIQHMCAGNDG